jgi:DNA-binding SARP family transcriptional activator
VRVTLGDVRVRILGEFEIEGLAIFRHGSRKARTLLKILILARGRPVAVDHLIECLWPGEHDAPKRPEDQVSVLISRLRAVLGPERLPRSDAGYKLVYDWLDLDALAQLNAEAARRLDAGNHALARTAAEAALALVRGPPLADEDAAWATAERAGIERLLVEASLTAADAALRGGNPVSAADYAAPVLESNAFDEAALRVLMLAHAASGRPAVAIAAYGQMRERLARELGIDPAPETEAVYLQLLRQQDAAGSSRHPPRAHVAAVNATELPGRDAELSALDAALEHAARGQLELFLVQGEAGIGKTRLLDTWALRAAASGVRVLRARCDELERILPLQPVADALDDALRVLPTETAVMTMLGAEHALLAPVLRACPPVSEVASVDPVGGQTVLFSALLTVFGRLASDTPVALLLDDVHLADRATLAWLHFAARRNPTMRLLVVGALRPEEDVALPQAQRLVLGPLDLDAVRAVVGNARAAELHARSGGYPLFLVELAAVEDGELPVSLRDAIAERCKRAGADVSASLHAAALLGSRIDLDLLAEVLNKSSIQLLTQLEEGARRGLLEERDTAFVFRHELVREALATQVSGLRQRVVHREAARVLAARINFEPLDVAYHASRAGVPEIAAPAYSRAARRAADRFDYAESDRLLSMAIDMADDASLRLQRAHTRLLRADLHGAESDALVALEGGAGAPALEAAGWAAYFRRDLEAAQRWADMGTQQADGAERVGCLVLAGQVRHAAGELMAAEAPLQQALDLSRGRAVGPAAYLGWLRIHQGRPREALDLASSAIRGGHPADVQLMVASAHMTTVHALASLGLADAALDAVEIWEQKLDQWGAVRIKGPQANFKAWILRSLAEFELADELNFRALAESRGATGMPEAEAHALLDLADGQLQRDQLDAAEKYLDEAGPLQELDHANRWRHELRYWLLRGRLAHARNRAEEAIALARRVHGAAAEMGAARYADLAKVLEIMSAAELGERSEPVVGVVLKRLPGHSGLEAWWLTAAVAAARTDPAIHELAEASAARLATHAGAYAANFWQYADARLQRMRPATLRG